MSNPLIDFLQKRLAEDEARNANNRGLHSWHEMDCGYDLVEGLIDKCHCNLSARVLLEVEAKRAIMEMFTHAQKAEDGEPVHGAVWAAYREERVAFQRTLYALASVYADHPDYLAEWAT